MDGFGNINWWGFSPAVDLLHLYNAKIEKLDSESIESQEINILLMNTGDQRHILKTLASKHKFAKNLRINFYVYEKMLELYARDFLLLSMALEHPAKMSVQEKTEMFLEIYGNILIRDHSAHYIIKRANEFIKYITDFECLAKTPLSLFDFNLLKFKERDFLEGIFKFWRLRLKADTCSEEDPNFPASKCWDVRLRSYFGTRYDTRKNAYDWDFQMKLIERKNCAIINNRIYSAWRDTGVAYELRDSSYDTPNKTLASGFVFNDPRNGDKTSRRGYFGDVVLGPFLGFGIESENKEFFRKQNDAHRYTTWDVSKSNVSLIMESILKSSDLDLSKYKRDDQLPKIIELDEIGEEEEEGKKKEQESIFDYFEVKNVKISFLPLAAPQDLAQKSKYDSFFDIVCFGNSALGQMNESIKKLLKSDKKSLVLFETAKYMIKLKNEQINGFSEKVKEVAKQNQLIDLSECETSLKNESDSNNSEKSIEQAHIESLDYLIFTTHR